MPKFLTPIDLNQNELRNVVLQNLAAAPSNPKLGQKYYDTALNIERCWNGVEWVNAGSVTSASITSALGYTPVDSSKVGSNNGIASLDATGKLPAAQLPESIVGAVVYQGVWNAANNTPVLASGVGTKGYYYKVSAYGTTAIDGISQWNVGDVIIFNGTTWDKIDGISNEVSKYAQSIGDGVATSIIVSHNLGTNDIVVQVYTAASPCDVVYPDIEFTSANSVTLIFAVAPTVNQYRVVVMG